MLAGMLETHAGLIFTNEENGTHESNFVIDSADVSTDFIDLSFGNSTGKKLRFDLPNNQFLLNTKLKVDGKISTNNYLEITPWTGNAAIYGLGSGNMWYRGIGGTSGAAENSFHIDGGTGLTLAGNLGLGITNPSTKLDIDGQIAIRGGVPGEGKVLTSDASGLATWEDLGLNEKELIISSSKITYENANASFLLEGTQQNFQYSDYINASPTKREIVRDFSAPGASGSLKITGTGSTYLGDDFIAVNPNKKYRGIVTGMQPSTNSAGTTYYWGITSYDADKNFIQHQMVNYYGNTVTALSQPLNTGDTIMHLTDATNWNNAGLAHQKAWIVWRLQPDGKYAYKGAGGKQYDELGYSREGGYASWSNGDVDFVANTVTLNTPWTGASIPIGTKVGNAYGGGTYNYYISNKSIPNDGNWDTYKSPWLQGQGQPQLNNGTDGAGSPAFRNGTSFVRVMALFNYRKNTGAAYDIGDVGYYSVLGIESASPDGFTGKNGIIEYDGFTKLGLDAPAIKQKKITGTTAATDGGSVVVSMGVDGGKVLGISGMIQYGAGPSAAIELGFSRPDNVLNSSYYISGTNLVITNNTGESGSILSKPFRAIITYEN